MRKITVPTLAKEMIFRFREDEVPALAAQLTFYLILSFFPFMIFLIALTAYTPLSREDVMNDLIAVLPHASADLVKGVFDDVLQTTTTTLLSLSMVATLWSASNGMMAMIRTLNKAYDEEEKRPYWKVRGISILYTVGLSAVICVAIALLVFGAMLGAFAAENGFLPPSLDLLWSALNVAMSLAVICGIFVLLYYSAPNRRIRLADTVPGAVLATVGWATLSWLFSAYVRHFGDFSKVYGSLGGIVVLLLWLYFGSVMLLLGGELNAALALLKEGRQRIERKPFGFRIPFFTKN